MIRLIVTEGSVKTGPHVTITVQLHSEISQGDARKALDRAVAVARRQITKAEVVA